MSSSMSETQVRNKAHTLPFFLSLFEQLRFPKDRIIIHIRSDLNEVIVISFVPMMMVTIPTI